MNRPSAIILGLLVALASCEAPRAIHGNARTVQPLLVPILHEGREKYQDIEGLEYTRAGHKEKGPKGIVFDGASVPWPFWLLMLPDGTHRYAAYIHDLCYGYKGQLPDGCRVTRAEADLEFYNNLRQAGFSKSRAGTAYRGVRMAGWHAWNNSTGTPTILPVEPRMMLAGTKPRLIKHIFAP